jgi:hypothetical protein
LFFVGTRGTVTAGDPYKTQWSASGRPNPKEADDMFIGIWDKARANKENIFYTILTIFLLERVRRGWNRIEERGRVDNRSVDEIERKQQAYTFGAALLYALPFLLPTVKYVYRSIDELSQYVGGLSALNNLWAFFAIVVLAQALLSIIIFNLLGIYVERMNDALGFFRKLGRSVVDGSKTAVHTVGVEAPTRLYGGVRSAIRGAARSTAGYARAAASQTGRSLRHAAVGIRTRGAGPARRIASKASALRQSVRKRPAAGKAIRVSYE